MFHIWNTTWNAMRSSSFMSFDVDGKKSLLPCRLFRALLSESIEKVKNWSTFKVPPLQFNGSCKTRNEDNQLHSDFPGR